MYNFFSYSLCRHSKHFTCIVKSFRSLKKSIRARDLELALSSYNRVAIIISLNFKSRK